eukprot:scpid67495/ scgid3797/ 
MTDLRLFSLFLLVWNFVVYQSSASCSIIGTRQTEIDSSDVLFTKVDFASDTQSLYKPVGKPAEIINFTFDLGSCRLYRLKFYLGSRGNCQVNVSFHRLKKQGIESEDSNFFKSKLHLRCSSNCTEKTVAVNGSGVLAAQGDILIVKVYQSDIESNEPSQPCQVQYVYNHNREMRKLNISLLAAGIRSSAPLSPFPIYSPEVADASDASHDTNVNGAQISDAVMTSSAALLGTTDGPSTVLANTSTGKQSSTSTTLMAVVGFVVGFAIFIAIIISVILVRRHQGKKPPRLQANTFTAESARNTAVKHMPVAAPAHNSDHSPAKNGTDQYEVIEYYTAEYCTVGEESHHAGDVTTARSGRDRDGAANLYEYNHLSSAGSSTTSLPISGAGKSRTRTLSTLTDLQGYELPIEFRNGRQDIQTNSEAIVGPDFDYACPIDAVSELPPTLPQPKHDALYYELETINDR